MLELKVADIAMGSGAFLVAACRYLAARLLEAWAVEAGAVDRVSAQPTFVVDAAIPADPLEREALAHRLVAERCLYGVDKNDMAVEMAKVSLWLITLAKDRPFSFVDHALRCWRLAARRHRSSPAPRAHIDRQAAAVEPRPRVHEIEAAVDRALDRRRELEGFVVNDVLMPTQSGDTREADAALDSARLLGDLVVGAALAGVDDADPLDPREVPRDIRTMVDTKPRHSSARLQARSCAHSLRPGWSRPAPIGEVEVVEWDDRQPFHWALEFPEVSAQGGFDAIVGNPPFQGGKKISGALGGHTGTT